MQTALIIFFTEGYKSCRGIRETIIEEQTVSAVSE